MNGNKLVIQYGLETTYGLGGTATKQIEVASESFALKINKKDEGLLTGSRYKSPSRTVSKYAEGGLSTLCRPDDIGLFLAALTGSEASAALVDGSTGAYSHAFSFTTSDYLPSLFFKVDRGVASKIYNGIVIDSVSFDSAAEDLLKLDLGLIGQDEADCTMETGLSVSPLAPFRFAGVIASVGGTNLDVVSVKNEIKNNHDYQTASNNTGLYYMQPETGTIDISTTLECIYDSNSNGVRDNYWLTDNTVAVQLVWTTGQNIETGFPYSLTLNLPVCQATDATPNVSGEGRIKFNLPLSVVRGTAPTITVVNGFNGTYLP